MFEDGRYEAPATNWLKDAPHYTTSLDAAVSIVPAGWNWSVTHRSIGCQAVVATTNGDSGPDVVITTLEAKAPTPVLAVCISIMKAFDKCVGKPDWAEQTEPELTA